MGIRRVENMCGGKGHVIIKDILEGDELKGKCGLYAQVTIEKGCSLGYHEHHGETETYYILSGEGEYDDNGVKRPVKAGDITITPDGKGHRDEGQSFLERLLFFGRSITHMLECR